MWGGGWETPEPPSLCSKLEGIADVISSQQFGEVSLEGSRICLLFLVQITNGKQPEKKKFPV